MIVSQRPDRLTYTNHLVDFKTFDIIQFSVRLLSNRTNGIHFNWDMSMNDIC